MCKTVHGGEQRGGGNGAGCRTTSGALARSNDRGKRRVLVRCGGMTEGGFDGVDDVVERLLPHAESGGWGTSGFEGSKDEEHNDSIET